MSIRELLQEARSELVSQCGFGTTASYQVETLCKRIDIALSQNRAEAERLANDLESRVVACTSSNMLVMSLEYAACVIAALRRGAK